VKRRRLGRSGLEVSEIGFGCMSLGGDHAANARLIDRALDLGINYFDTADLYQHGENERTLGRALRGRRQDALIATKVGNQWRGDGSGWDWNPRKSYILAAVKQSLKRLETDHIDLYQLHGGTLEDPIDETIEAFEELVQSGAVLHYGISSIRPTVIARWVERSHMTSVMLQYSLLDRRPEEQCLALLRESDVGVAVRGGVAKGLLAGKPAEAYLDRDADAVSRAQELLRSTCGSATPGQAAIRYCLANAAVSSVVCGVRTASQLEENAAASDLAAPDAGSLDALRTGIPASRYEAHRI